jgi:glycosyltransferase involved in cell wall biosynthesis
MNENKKTILYIGGFELPDKNAAAQRVVAVGKLLRLLGYRVVFIGIDRTLPGNSNIESTKREYFGFEAWAVPYPKSTIDWMKQITSIKDVSLLIDKYFKNNVFAIICYNYPAVALAKMRNLCRRNDYLFIPDATEWHGHIGGGLLFNVIKWLDTTLRMRLIHPTADGIIATSKYLEKYYQRKNCKTVKLPTLFDAELLEAAPQSAQKKEKNVKYIMYAGNAFDARRVDRKRKNIKDRLDLIIELIGKVISENQNVRLDIYGLTKENYLGVYHEHTQLLEQLKDVISFLGRKPHDEIIAEIKRHDFTIFLRESDRVTEAGFPSKYSESISCGTPVITNMLSNISDYMIEGTHGYFIDLHDQEKQLVQMINILSINDQALDAVKKRCMQSKTFDYRYFIQPVRHFIETLGVK